ncbi:MAG TPA: hypothetical protein VMU45_06425 [Candidatus Eisenbacteria bacterium]|nr:hypothetical protein [Candidatus Eisenbacteria bacterium]
MSVVPVRTFLAIALLLSAGSAIAQDSPFGQSGPAPTGKQQSPPPKQPAHVPDMVCFGNNPRWSFQFGDQAARTLGISEGDTYWIGKFTYADGQWTWHGSPATGSGGGLTATITRGKCIDKTQADTKEFPYQGQVYLPEGDIVNGCCRRLKPNEAPVGPHGYIPNTPPPQ